jgi:FAD/FMN-containing dehydrogenase/Fe-S oxidoreductase
LTQRVGKVTAEIRRSIAGEVRSDRLSRAIYATDASFYQIVPDAVVLPKTAADVAAAVRACAKHGVLLTARGAGTGLTGGAVNRGLILDCSRYLNRIVEVDPERRWARVQPGVVLDEFNAELKRFGLQFAPDVATSSRATLGGMIANNSCGARSILYGRTVDHVLSIDVVLSDGSTHTWGRDAPPSDNPLAARCEEVLRAVARDCADEIAARFPKVLRSNGGYGLDRLVVRGGRANPEAVVCGSEGTLGVVVGAELNLTPLPKCKGLVVAHFDELLPALAAVPTILEHQPAAVELVDQLILDTARTNPTLARRCGFLVGDPRMILIIELYDDDAAVLERRLRGVADELRGRRMGRAWPVLTGAAPQADVWLVRKSGLGLLLSKPGDLQPNAFVEDTAVDPSRLGEFIERFGKLLAEEGVEETGYYAHASVGCLHVRPVLNLKRRDDVERMRRIADRVSSLVLEFGGTMTGEHGDGIIRSCWLEKMYGPRIVEAFRKIKSAFDPRGILNPGKIVDPLPMTENLRFVPSDGAGRGTAASAVEAPADRGAAVSTEETPARRRCHTDTILDFGAYGGMAGLAGMCSGVGECRQRLVGTMCPSYMATGDETHTTRARANALRIALTGGGLLDGLSDPALAEVMDLCLSCKACRSECPTGVDMGRLKAEWLHQRQRARGVPRRSRLIAALPALAEWGCRLAPVSNWIAQSRVVRALLERVFGLDRRVPPPRFARRTFRAWFGETKSRGLRMQTPSHGLQAVRSPRAGGPRYPEKSRGLRMQTPSRGLQAARPIERGMNAAARATGETRAPHNIALPERQDHDPSVVYFVDTWTNCFAPQVGIAAVRVLEALGYEVMVPPTRCCGRPAISKGLLDEARRLAEANVTALAPYAAAGIAIVGAEPSCISTLVDEYPQLVRTPEARQVAKMSRTIESFVAEKLRERPGLIPDRADGRRLLYHGHCHQKALSGTAEAMEVLSACTGGKAAEIDSGCCGMAGSFGHEVEHYEVARAVAEQRLLPAIRAGGDADIVVSGFSCRQQIEHHAGVRARHLIEIVAEALTEGASRTADRE